MVAARLVAALHDADGRVTLPRFYDAGSPAHGGRGAVARHPTVRRGGVQGAGGGGLSRPVKRAAPRWSGSGPGRPRRSSGSRPGYGGAGIKTIVPAVANLKIAFRLVPDQRPEEVTSAFDRGWPSRFPPGVTVTARPEGRWPLPSRRSTIQPWVRSAGPSSGCGGPAPLFTREGGSGPEEALGRVLAGPGVVPRRRSSRRSLPRPQRADGHGSVLERPAGGGRVADRARGPSDGRAPPLGRPQARAAAEAQAEGPPGGHEWVSLR